MGARPGEKNADLKRQLDITNARLESLGASVVEIGAAGAAESELNAQRHASAAEQAAVLQARVRDAEDVAVGAADAAVKAEESIKIMSHAVEGLKEKVARLRAARAMEEKAEKRALLFDDTAHGATGVELVTVAAQPKKAAVAPPPGAAALSLAAAEPSVQPSAAEPEPAADAGPPPLPSSSVATTDESDEQMGDAVGTEKTSLANEPKRARILSHVTLENGDTAI